MLKGTEETLTIYSLATTEGTFTNYANVTCNETEWNYTNNFDNETVDVKKNPDIEKTVNNTKPYHYEFVEYYLTITNTEEIDYTNSLVVIDSLPDGLVYAETLNVEGATLVNTVVDGQIITWTIKDIKAKYGKPRQSVIISEADASDIPREHSRWLSIPVILSKRFSRMIISRISRMILYVLSS